MKRKIQQSARGIKIDISDTDRSERDLLKELTKCQSGTCSCPTNEYSKLDTMDIEESMGKITLRLKPKEGENFDVTEIEKCLAHTEKQIKPSR